MRSQMILVGGVVLVAASLFASASIAGAKNQTPASADQDARAGTVLYQAKCGGCHSVDANRIGPAHRNVVGSRIASAPGYAYSPALLHVRGTWTRSQLDRWLQGPQRFAPGAKMFLVVDDPSQRRAIITYLVSVSSRPRH